MNATGPEQPYVNEEFDDLDKIEDLSKSKIHNTSFMNTQPTAHLKLRPSTHGTFFSTFHGKLTDISTQIIQKRAITKLIKVPFKYSCYQIGSELPTQCPLSFNTQKESSKGFSATQTYSPLLLHTFYKSKPKMKPIFAKPVRTKQPSYIGLLNINKNSIFLPTTFLTSNPRCGLYNLINKLNSLHKEERVVPLKVRRSVSCSRRNRNISVHNTQDNKLL